MKTIRLDVNDNIFDKVMLFLSNLPKKDIQLIKIESKETLQSLANLYLNDDVMKNKKQYHHCKMYLEYHFHDVHQNQ